MPPKKLKCKPRLSLRAPGLKIVDDFHWKNTLFTHLFPLQLVALDAGISLSQNQICFPDGPPKIFPVVYTPPAVLETGGVPVTGGPPMLMSNLVYMYLVKFNHL